MNKITLHLSIYGRVQGVFFRESMRTKAQELGVTGWVRNRSDGSVEAVIQGTPENIQIMTAWAQKGPPAAHVERLEVTEDMGEFSSFDRLPNG